jgi:hypothetical protein
MCSGHGKTTQKPNPINNIDTKDLTNKHENIKLAFHGSPNKGGISCTITMSRKRWNIMVSQY